MKDSLDNIETKSKDSMAKYLFCMIGLMPDGVNESDLKKLHLPHNMDEDIHFLIIS